MRPHWRAFWRQTEGGSAVMVALGFTAVLGATALAVDYSRAASKQQFLSAAADAAALAAVSRLPDVDAARRTALEYVEKNLPGEQYGKALTADDIEFGFWDAETRSFISENGGNDGGGGGAVTDQKAFDTAFNAAFVAGGSPTAVRITTRMAEANGNEIDTLFAWAFGNDSMDVSASAIAGRGGPPCVIALDPTGSSAFSMAGKGSVETVGCAVQVNSTALPAFDVKGGASIQATDICVGGTASYKDGAAVPEPKEHCPAISDPMAGLEPPAYGSCDHESASYKGSTETLEPGVYCGGLDISGKSDVTLAPGLYVIKDGPFAVEGKSSVTGSGVTLFLTGDEGLVSLKSGSNIDLAAPTDGPMEGVLIFQDRDFGGTHDWKGKSSTELRGVIYLPSGTLVSKNDNSITPEGACVVLIAYSLAFSASSGASIDITNSGCREALPGPYGRGIVLLQ